MSKDRGGFLSVIVIVVVLDSEIEEGVVVQGGEGHVVYVCKIFYVIPIV